MKNNKQINLKPSLHVIEILILSSLLFYHTGCNYYKMNVKRNVTIDDIRWQNYNDKYFILHKEDSAWQFTNLSIDNNLISGELSVLPSEHYKYLTTKLKGGNKYDKKTEKYVLNEVHLYLKDSLYSELRTTDNISFDVSALEKIIIYQTDKGRTNTSKALAITLPIVGAVGIMITVIALTKSSCPLVYIKKNQEFTFAGEIFGGAVYSSLERDDYMPIPGFKPIDNIYTLKINNELPEIQYINLAELWVVSHPENTMVLPDRNGKIQTYSNPIQPIEAFSFSGKDQFPQISTMDQNSFLFDEEPILTGDTNAINSVVMTFNFPEYADTGKLIIRAGNSLWGDYVSGELTKLFGNKYDDWIKKQGKEPAEKNILWRMDQRFVLMVYLETRAGWQFVDYFDLIGPLGVREMIMPIILNNALISKSKTNEEIIRIKLESGFKFWELDYAAMDFSQNGIFSVDILKPHSATTEKGKDVTELISDEDTKYYIQKIIGEEGLVVYPDCPEIPGMKKSVFLHTKGYYEHLRDYKYPPEKEQLLTFRIPGRLSQFSYNKYQNFINTNAILVSNPNFP